KAGMAPSASPARASRPDSADNVAHTPPQRTLKHRDALLQLLSGPRQGSQKACQSSSQLSAAVPPRPPGCGSPLGSPSTLSECAERARGWEPPSPLALAPAHSVFACAPRAHSAPARAHSEPPGPTPLSAVRRHKSGSSTPLASLGALGALAGGEKRALGSTMTSRLPPSRWRRTVYRRFPPPSRISFSHPRSTSRFSSVP